VGVLRRTACFDENEIPVQIEKILSYFDNFWGLILLKPNQSEKIK